MRENELEWSELGNCKGIDTRIFFPGPSDYETVKLAKSFCVGCKIKEDCLKMGMQHNFGIWGGLSANERKKLRKRKQVA